MTLANRLPQWLNCQTMYRLVRMKSNRRVSFLTRQREKAEDESIELMRERRLTMAANTPKKGDESKEKKTKEEKKREKKERKKAEKERKKEEKEINKTSKSFGLTFRRKVLADK